jgi:hypothetical protein
MDLITHTMVNPKRRKNKKEKRGDEMCDLW